MKWTGFFFLLLLPIFSCGCVTLASHTKEADNVTARFATATSDILCTAYGTDPAYAYQAQQLRSSSQELQRIAEKNPGISIPPQAVGGIASIIAMLTGPGCLAGAAFGLKKMMDCNNMRGLVKDLSNMDKEESKEHIIKHKVAI